MMRAGRELEVLIAQLERTLVPEGATVTSPDHLPDRTTGLAREVDVSIRMHVGSAEVIIIAECRDHASAQDVTWIEQLVQKRDDLNVSRAIAVSPSGFSQQARKKGRFYGLELRTVDELTPEVLRNWFRIIEFTVQKRRSSIHAITASLTKASVEQRAGGSQGLPTSESIRLHEQRFVWSDGERMNARELWASVQRKVDAHVGLSLDGTRLRREIEVTPVPGALRMRIRDTAAIVETLRFAVDVWLDAVVVPLHRVHRYSSDNEGLVETVEYLFEVDGHEEIVALHKDLRAGGYRMSRRGVSGEEALPDAWVRITDAQGRPLLRQGDS